MKNIIAHRFMRNFKTFEEMKEWLEKYRVYEFYEPHVKGCWKAMQEHKLIKREHELDYELVVQKMKPNSKRENKLRLNIYRKIRKIEGEQNV